MPAVLLAPVPVLMPLPVLGCTAMCPAMLWLPAMPGVLPAVVTLPPPEVVVPEFTWPLLLVPPLLPVFVETVLVLQYRYAVSHVVLLELCQSLPLCLTHTQEMPPWAFLSSIGRTRHKTLQMKKGIIAAEIPVQGQGNRSASAERPTVGWQRRCRVWRRPSG